MLPPGREAGVPIEGQSGSLAGEAQIPATDQHEMFDPPPPQPLRRRRLGRQPTAVRITAGMVVISRCMTSLLSPMGLDGSRAASCPARSR